MKLSLYFACVRAEFKNGVTFFFFRMSGQKFFKIIPVGILKWRNAHKESYSLLHNLVLKMPPLLLKLPTKKLERYNHILQFVCGSIFPNQWNLKGK